MSYRRTFTGRERRYVALLAQGLTIQEIADTTGVKFATARLNLYEARKATGNARIRMPTAHHARPLSLGYARPDGRALIERVSASDFYA